ncbi:uncharacterized protein LOC107010628 isoform X2 [Solanum pennellii]|uniref:Uncharacterized protein LOC107010628 isoform X2 n=1 Tax=Solanum pennellii TaxID=28526 RepID=A0ABM1G3B1_SOLPN|nr:uncharacterized protein LOC107010628 isoform X2 [Solanum pennellii]
MRIRKHAKISPLHYASSIFLQQHGVVLQPHVCQLNQSPWDVITFPAEDLQNDNIINHHTLHSPPPPAPAPSSSSYKLDGYDSYAVNGTFYDSELSITSMKLEVSDNERKDIDNIVADVPADSGNLEKDGNDNITTMCVKNDGKGWQCSRESKIGHNLCEHHFAQKQYSSSNNESVHSTTTATSTAAVAVAVAAGETTQSSRGRPHRSKKSSSSEFYYYSGFGPLWGKKRGSSSTGKSTQGAQSSSSQIDDEVFDYEDDEEDEYDDNDDERVGNNKLKIKRTRKPIKARSLKSLM